jgi:hypothetical protein
MKRVLLALGLLVVMILPISASADGMIIPPPGYWMYETDQKAVIVHENGIETLMPGLSQHQVSRK